MTGEKLATSVQKPITEAKITVFPNPAKTVLIIPGDHKNKVLSENACLPKKFWIKSSRPDCSGSGSQHPDRQTLEIPRYFGVTNAEDFETFWAAPGYLIIFNCLK